MPYCNLTTDLKEVYPGIFDLFVRKILGEDWTAASGQSNTYQQEGHGYVNMVYDGGVQLTPRADIATTESNAGSFYDDTDTNVLYVHAIGSDDLTSSPPTIQIGEDMDAYLTIQQNSVMEEIDSYLSRILITPLLARMEKVHSSNDYESIVRLTCAYLICRNVARQRDPESGLAMGFEQIALGFNPEDGEEKGYIAKILDGELNLQDQILTREVGSVGTVIPNSSNSGTGYIHILPTSKYTGSTLQEWRLQIETTDGAPGTALWKLSYDTGANFDITGKATFDATNDNRRTLIGSGIYVRFDGTFVAGDYWDITLHPLSDVVSNPRIGSIEMLRK